MSIHEVGEVKERCVTLENFERLIEGLENKCGGCRCTQKKVS